MYIYGILTVGSGIIFFQVILSLKIIDSTLFEILF